MEEEQQWNLRTRNTLGVTILSPVEKLSVSWRSNSTLISVVPRSRPYLRGSLIGGSTVDVSGIYETK